MYRQLREPYSTISQVHDRMVALGRIAVFRFAPCVDGSGLARVSSTFCTLLVGAAMCPAFVCGTERGRWP